MAIYGDDNDNILFGTSSWESIYGYGGDDSLYGLEDDDYLYGGSGNDYLSGGTGTDRASYLFATAGVTVSLLITTAQNTGGDGTDTLVAIEDIGGSDYGDTLRGNDGVNWLLGYDGDDALYGNGGSDFIYGGDGSDYLNVGSGNDYLSGGTGADKVSYFYATAGVTVSLLNPAAQNTGGDGTDTLVSIENIWGSNYDDTLTGNDGANQFYGFNGNDILYGNGGSDEIYGHNGSDRLFGDAGDDTLNGGSGTDGAFYNTATTAVSVNLNTTTSQATGGAGNDTLVGIENLTGSNFNDILIGDAAANILNGGAGLDTMIGGLGNDTYYVDSASDVISEISSIVTEIDTVFSSVSHSLGANLEKLTLFGTAAINGVGNALANTLVGNSAANILNGGAGSDTMIGGLGNDTYSVDNASDVISETSPIVTEIDTVISSVSHSLGANLERLTLIGTAAINGVGNALANTLVGNSAVNILLGSTGNDYLFGGTGNDHLVGGAGSDNFVFNTALNATTNKDIITDFNAAADTISLDKTIFAKLTTLGTLNAGLFRSSATGTAADANDYVLYNTTSGALLYDADANGAGVAVQFATLTTKPAITSADFFVVA
ncbi:MAG: calcium-binding protein [Desulfoprunum sp.]|nr:calcium-binding protein [Desulfoprunum sp.]